MVEDPGVSLVESQPEQWNVIAAEAARFLPDIAVAEQPSHRDDMTQSRSGAFSPDANLDQAVAEFVNWLSWHRLCLRSGDTVQLDGEICEHAALAGWDTAVICQGRRQDLAEFDEILHVRGSQELGNLPVTLAHAVDIKAI